MPPFTAFKSSIPVRPDDIDMNRHVHNSKYNDYVLAARYDQMARCYGMSMEAFLERGLSWVVRASYIEHKRPLFIGDTAEVETWVEEIASRSVKVGFQITKESDSKSVAKGWLDYVLVSLESGRPQALPADIIATYSL
ncbi:MAG: acyl-CoA thioesterase [Verrucomicrobiales bacterium]|nr:acyl-CoA thioesterase [Verrucomicrobiales bacterium]